MKSKKPVEEPTVPRRVDAKRDSEGHCSVCGLSIDDFGDTEATHVCPPGFRTIPVNQPISYKEALKRIKDAEKEHGVPTENTCINSMTKANLLETITAFLPYLFLSVRNGFVIDKEKGPAVITAIGEQNHIGIRVVYIDPKHNYEWITFSKKGAFSRPLEKIKDCEF